MHYLRTHLWFNNDPCIRQTEWFLQEKQKEKQKEGGDGRMSHTSNFLRQDIRIQVLCVTPPFPTSGEELLSSHPSHLSLGLRHVGMTWVPVNVWPGSSPLFHLTFSWLSFPLNFPHFKTEQTPLIHLRGQLTSALCLFCYSVLRAKNLRVSIQLREKFTAANSSWSCLITQRKQKCCPQLNVIFSAGEVGNQSVWKKRNRQDLTNERSEPLWQRLTTYWTDLARV